MIKIKPIFQKTDGLNPINPAVIATPDHSEVFSPSAVMASDTPSMAGAMVSPMQPVSIASIPPRRNPTTVVGRKGLTSQADASQSPGGPTFNPPSREKTHSQPAMTKRELFQ